MMKDLVIGLGSNLGDRRENLNEAIRRMASFFGEPVKVSTFIETEPWGFETGNRFLNGAAVFKVEKVEKVEMVEMVEKVEKVLGVVQGIEREMGRVKIGDGYSDRIIDLDILFYGDIIFNSPELTIPHPHLHEREFVLGPLVEICPGRVHPVLGLTIREIIGLAALG